MIVKKPIGKLPVLIGEYDSTKTYDKKNRVTLYGSEFESLIDSNTYAPATYNSDTKTVTFDTEHWKVVSNGTGAWLAGEKLDQFSFEDNPEFVSADTDNEGKLLESTNVEGKKTFYGDVEVKGNVTSDALDSKISDATEKAVENKVDKEDGKSLIDENVANRFSEEDSPEYVAVNADSDDKIIDSVGNDGTITHNTKHIFKNGIEDAEGGLKKEALRYVIDNSSDLAKALKDGGFLFSANDWSDYISNDGDNPLHLPEPRCAIINFITTDGRDRLGVVDGQKAQMQFWDGYGNYFKKWVNLDQQGDSSKAQWKRNIAVDMFDSEYDGDAFAVKFGNWVAQDSFHLKAYYEDIIRGVNVVNYKLCDIISKSRGVFTDRPYKEYTNVTSTNSGNSDHDKDLQYDARTISDGFPAIIFLNSSFYGIFPMQLKKHRDNFNLDRNSVSQFHLDGYLGGTEFWDGTIDWTRFEIRNPKPKSKKWTLLCQDGSKYDGDNPKEIMGTDSSSYNADDTSCVNSAKLKENIVAVSKYMSEIKVYENAYSTSKSDEDLATLKAEIEKRFGVSQMIDLIISFLITRNTDIYKNVQWVTWGAIDGTIKMYACPWDMDGTYGINSTHGFSIGGTLFSQYGNISGYPMSYIWNYYSDDVATRYKYLRSKGIISPEISQQMILDWYGRIGDDNYALEFDKWDESPCHRDSNISDKWKLATGTTEKPSAVTYYWETDDYKDTNNYAKNAFAKVNHILYQSLQDSNTGHAVTETDWWKQVSYKEGESFTKGDTVYDGYNTFRLFEAQEDTSERPFTKFYSHYPVEGGNYDSVLRICAWIKEQYKTLDAQFNYTEN